MSYESKPIFSAQQSTDTVEQRLRQACDKRTAHGIAGIRNLNSRGEYDGTMTFKDFYMHPDVFELGCAVEIEPEIWASWMMNTELEIRDNLIIIHSPNGFYADHAKGKVGGAIAKHYSRPVRFRSEWQLGKVMDKQ